MDIKSIQNSVGDRNTVVALSSIGNHRPASLIPEISAVRPKGEGMVIVRSKDGWSEERLCRWGVTFEARAQPQFCSTR